MRNYWQLQRWFQSQEVQKHQFYQNRRVYFIHNSEDFSPLETRYRSSVDGLQKESDGGSALLLYRSSAFPFFKRRPPRCFWTLFAFSDPHSFVHRPDTVSLRTSGWKMCCGILVNGLFLKRQSLCESSTTSTRLADGVSADFSVSVGCFFSDIRALIFSPCLKWAVNCHGSVTGLWAFFFLLLPFDRIHCEPLLCSKMIDYTRFYLGTWKQLVVIHLLLRRSHLMSQ